MWCRYIVVAKCMCIVQMCMWLFIWIITSLEISSFLYVRVVVMELKRKSISASLAHVVVHRITIANAYIFHLFWVRNERCSTLEFSSQNSSIYSDTTICVSWWQRNVILNDGNNFWILLYVAAYVLRYNRVIRCIKSTVKPHCNSVQLILYHREDDIEVFGGHLDCAAGFAIDLRLRR